MVTTTTRVTNVPRDCRHCHQPVYLRHTDPAWPFWLHTTGSMYCEPECTTLAEPQCPQCKSDNYGQAPCADCGASDLHPKPATPVAPEKPLTGGDHVIYQGSLSRYLGRTFIVNYVGCCDHCDDHSPVLKVSLYSPDCTTELNHVRTTSVTRCH